MKYLGRIKTKVASSLGATTFKEIWNGELMKDFRSELKRAGGIFPACTRCCGVL